MALIWINIEHLKLPNLIRVLQASEGVLFGVNFGLNNSVQVQCDNFDRIYCALINKVQIIIDREGLPEFSFVHGRVRKDPLVLSYPRALVLVRQTPNKKHALK